MAGPNDRMVASQSDLERALSDRTTRIKVAPAAVLARMQLSPEEGFLLSRLDQPIAVSDLLVISGLSEERTLQVLMNALVKGAALVEAPAPGGRTATPLPFRAATPMPFRAPTPQPFRPAAPAPPSVPVGPYGSFVFSLRDLNEDVDLDTEFKKRVLFLHANLGRFSHYKVLGLSASATGPEIRKAFLERSKEFHPDSYFRKRLGSYLERIEAIFRRIREANDVLTNEASRAKYDREGKQFDAEETAVIARRQIEELEEEQREKMRKERLMHARGFARLTKAREEMASGDQSLEKGDMKGAIRSYQLAMELDPRLDEARTKLAEARRIAAVQRADASIEQAARAEAEGDTARAITLLMSAIEIDAVNPRIYFALAGMKFRGGLDLKEARMHARKAQDLGDRSGKSRLLMGEILLALGEKKLAKVELKAALELGENRAKDLL